MADIKPARKLAESNLKTAEYERQIWTVTPEPGTTIAEIVENPSYWVHVSTRFKPDHEILVRDPARKYRLHLLVRSCGDGWAKVVILQKWDFEVQEAAEVQMPETTEYEVMWAGAAKWRIKRLMDNKVMVDGLATKLEAARWLTDHLAKIAA